jgi:ABC-2 type transport system permease protein
LINNIDWHILKVLAKKELQQLFRHKQTIFLISVSIVVMIVMPLLVPILTLLGYSPGGRTLLEGMRYIAFIMLPMFLLYPPMVTNAMVTDSFAGEKERKTIETTLLLPCSTSMLVIAKVVASMIPAYIFDFGGFLAIGLITNISIASYGVVIIFNEIEWYVMIFIVAPLVVLLFNLLGILASIITRSVKGAQGISSIPAIPIILLIMTIAVNNILLTWSMLVTASLACIIIDLGLFWLCIRSFDREKFLLQSD